MWAIGADVQKKSTTFYTLDDDGQPVRDFNEKFSSIRSNLESYLAVRENLGDRKYRILWRTRRRPRCHLDDGGAGMDAIVAHSPDLEKMTKSDKKTDKNDARDLAMYLLARMSGAEKFNLSYMCSKEDMMARQLCRAAKLEMVERGNIKRRTKSHALLYEIDVNSIDPVTNRGQEMLSRLHDPVIDNLVQAMRDGQARQKSLEAEIERLFAGNRVFEMVDEIPYFGLVTAAYLTSYISDISRFRNAEASWPPWA